jgi:hypothetical protein
LLPNHDETQKWLKTCTTDFKSVDYVNPTYPGNQNINANFFIDDFDPDGSDGVVDETDFDSFYDYFGYEPCDSAEAIIILYKKTADIREYNPLGINHASRKSPNNCKCDNLEMFTSKNGYNWPLIEHERDSLNWGIPFKFYRRKN